MYIAKFNSRGSCMEIYEDTMFPEVKAEMLANGCFEISDTERDYYVGNMGDGDNGTGYIRDAVTGKPVSAPPAPKPSKAQRISQLEKDFKSARFTIGTYYMEAVLDGNVEVQKDLQVELSELKEQFESDVAAIMSEEE